MHHDRGSFTLPPCALAGVHAVEARSAHTFPRHSHDEYGVGLIVRGAQRSWSGRGRVEAGCGDVITCNPGEVHDGAPIGEERVWKMLYLAPSLVAEIGDHVHEGASALLEFDQPVISRRPPAGLFKAAYRALVEPRADAELARERLILLLAHMLSPRPAATRRAPAAIARAKAWIDEDPAAAISLRELAHESGVSQYQFLRSFARATGVTPHAYIVQRRLASARTLIAAGASLAYAAGVCGFADQSHFTRSFARLYGHTPGQYAQAVRPKRQRR